MTDTPKPGSDGQVSPLSQGEVETWKELWAAIFLSHYNASYEELCADFLVARWRLIDTVTKFLTSATAAGSTVAAWTFWVTADTGAGIWAAVSGVAALLSLFHTSAGITERIKDDTMVFAAFQQLRLELDYLKVKMRIQQYDSLARYKTVSEILTKFSKAYGLKRPGFLLTKRRQDEIQKELNRSLGYV